MQKRILAVAAVVFAIALSSFTVKRTTDYYLTYKGTGFNQQALSGYTAARPTSPLTHVTGGAAILNWVKVVDDVPAGLSDAEVQAAFNFYNQVDPTSLTLDDEIDVADELDIKNANL